MPRCPSAGATPSGRMRGRRGALLSPVAQRQRPAESRLKSIHSLYKSIARSTGERSYRLFVIPKSQGSLVAVAALANGNGCHFLSLIMAHQRLVAGSTFRARRRPRQCLFEISVHLSLVIRRSRALGRTPVAGLSSAVSVASSGSEGARPLACARPKHARQKEQLSTARRSGAPARQSGAPPRPAHRPEGRGRRGAAAGR